MCERVCEFVCVCVCGSVRVCVCVCLIVDDVKIQKIRHLGASWFLAPQKGTRKAVPLYARRGPKGSRKLRFPHFVTTAQDGGKVVILTHRPPLPTRNTPGTHFC